MLPGDAVTKMLCNSLGGQYMYSVVWPIGFGRLACLLIFIIVSLCLIL